MIGGNDIAWGMVDLTDTPKCDLVNKVRGANIATLQSLQLLGTAPALTSAPQNGATYLTGGLVPGSWALVKGTNLSDVSRTWNNADFANLGDGLPTVLSGVQVLVNGTAAAVYYISPTQINFQVPAGISGTANVEVIRDGVASNTMSGGRRLDRAGHFSSHRQRDQLPRRGFPGRSVRGRSVCWLVISKCETGRHAQSVRHRPGAIACRNHRRRHASHRRHSRHRKHHDQPQFRGSGGRGRIPNQFHRAAAICQYANGELSDHNIGQQCLLVDNHRLQSAWTIVLPIQQ